MRRHLSLKVTVLAALFLALLAVLPASAAEDETAGPGPLAVTLERMAELLARLDAELASVDRPVADRLEQRVEEAVGLVQDLLASLGDESDESSPRAQAVRLDLTLHRLVGLLEEVVGEPKERPQARMTLGEIRAWVDGYVASATSGMSAREAERFDRAARDLARALVAQLARVTKKAAAPDPGAVRLPQLIERLDALASRLDALLLRRAANDAAEAPEP